MPSRADRAAGGLPTRPSYGGSGVPVRKSVVPPAKVVPVVRSTISPARGPVRTCVGCRRRTAKSELMRVVAGKGPDGRPAVVPDPTATAPGRGAHLHPTTECFDLAVRRKAFSRALRAGEGLSSAPLADHLTARPTVIDRQETGAGSS